jgi:hypothetical protein
LSRKPCNETRNLKKFSAASEKVTPPSTTEKVTPPSTTEKVTPPSTTEKVTPPSTALSQDQLVPHLPDETRLIRLKADTEAFEDKSFVLSGAIRLTHKYQGSYERYESTFYSFEFTENGKTWGDRGYTISAYLSRRMGKPIADRIIKSQEEREARGEWEMVIACRIKATMDKRRWTDWTAVEILDIQFLNDNGDGWGPWMLGTAEVPR